MAPLRGGGGGGNGDLRSERSRRISIKNRTQNICKKASELSTFCDVDLALVCYPPGASGPAIWPSDRSKVEEAIRRYVDAPANKKLPKNQITLHDPNPGTDKSEDAGKTVVATAEKADRIRIPFPDDEDKLRELEGILESRIAKVQTMIAIRRMERRRYPRPSARDPMKKLARGKAAPPPTLEAAAGKGGAPNFSL